MDQKPQVPSKTIVFELNDPNGLFTVLVGLVCEAFGATLRAEERSEKLEQAFRLASKLTSGETVDIDLGGLPCFLKQLNESDHILAQIGGCLKKIMASGSKVQITGRFKESSSEEGHT